MNYKDIRTIALIDKDDKIILIPVREQDNVEANIIYNEEDIYHTSSIVKIAPKRPVGIEVKLNYDLPTPEIVYCESTLGGFLNGIYSK